MFSRVFSFLLALFLLTAPAAPLPPSGFFSAAPAPAAAGSSAEPLATTVRLLKGPKAVPSANRPPASSAAPRLQIRTEDSRLKKQIADRFRNKKLTKDLLKNFLFQEGPL